MHKIIFHLDNDSYFASAHASVEPQLKGKPVVVSTNQKRSIITAASYEAKNLGIKAPMPLYEAQKLCPDIIVVKPNFNLYTVLSTKLFEFLSTKYTKEIEVASIDECFLDVTEVWPTYGSPRQLALHMQKSILKTFALPVSIGISTNKFVAKMSTALNKPLGISITKPSAFLKVFGQADINQFYGIGAASAKKLKNNQINTIGDLAQADPQVLTTILGKVAPTFIKQANGYGDDYINTEHNELKGIGNSITFLSHDKFFRQDILAVLKELCAKVAHRAYNRNLVGYVVTVGIKAAVKGKTQAQTKQKKLTVPIYKLADIFQQATNLFDQVWNEEPLKFISISLGKLANLFETTYQADLFMSPKAVRKIDQIMQNVNRKFKQRVLFNGIEAKRNQIKKQNQSRYIENDLIIKHLDD